MKDIPGYEGLYAVTGDGRVWSYPKPPRNPDGMWLQPRLATDRTRRIKARKVYQVGLHKDGKTKQSLIHRLVALVYLSNPDGKPDINHKNGDSLDNRVENLEWCTQTENMRHAMQSGLLDIHSGRQDETRRENGRKTIGLNSLKRKLFVPRGV